MILWILCLAAFTLTTTKCEPPVNSYLPPNAGIGAGGQPSSQYGPPGGNQGSQSGFGPNTSGLGNRPQDGYNSAQFDPSSPSLDYGVPIQGSRGFPSGGSRGFPAQGQGSVPSSEYGSPNQEGQNEARGASRGRGSQRPDSSYGTPSNNYQASRGTGFNGRNSGSGSRQPFGGSPSSSYGTPDFGNDLNNFSKNYRGSGVNEQNEPAKYEFSYEVDDPITGTKFGHSEQRDGDLTTGEYNVVLPDGRKQVVEYEADQDGYKPQIRYEGAGTGSGFQLGGAQSRNQGLGGSANANAIAGGNAGYPQSGNGPQSGRYQEPGFDIDQGSGTAGYPSGRPSNQGRNGNGNPGSRGRGSSGTGIQSGDDFDGNQGYPRGRQGSRGSTRGGGRGSDGFGGQDGYPSGGPDGLRGSGY